MAQFEIEIKLPLKNLKETLKFLTDQGFQETAQIQEEDTYFNSVYHDVKKRDEALRIRTSTDCRSGISKTQINFKGPKLDKISMSRMELETEVSDAEVLKKYSHPFGFFSGSVCHENAKVYEMWQIYRLSRSGRGTWRLSGA